MPIILKTIEHTLTNHTNSLSIRHLSGPADFRQHFNHFFSDIYVGSFAYHFTRINPGETSLITNEPL